jgi:hypothetical protein
MLDESGIGVAIVVAVIFTVGTMRGWFDGDSPEGASASSV